MRVKALRLLQPTIEGAGDLAERLIPTVIEGPIRGIYNMKMHEATKFIVVTYHM
jgi:hypothetical protein